MPRAFKYIHAHCLVFHPFPALLSAATRSIDHLVMESVVVPLLAQKPGEKGSLTREVVEESKKLWEIVGPAMFMRLVLYSLNVISQAFAGHIGDLELAAFSIANTVVSGLTFGLLVCQHIPYN